MENDIILYDSQTYIFITPEILPEEINFVTIRSSSGIPRDMVLMMFTDCYERLKILCERPNLHIKEVQFYVREVLLEPWKSDYTCQLKSSV